MSDEKACFICQAKGNSGTASANGQAVAVPFRNPAFPGHCVVAPAAHRDLEETTDADWLAMGQLARQTSKTFRDENPDVEKCYLVAIGDVDRGHLHFHVLPKEKEGPSLGPFVFGDAGWLRSSR